MNQITLSNKKKLPISICARTVFTGGRSGPPGRKHKGGGCDTSCERGGKLRRTNEEEGGLEVNIGVRNGGAKSPTSR